MAPKRQKRQNIQIIKNRSRFAKRSKNRNSSNQRSIARGTTRDRDRKTAPAQQPIAPAPPLKRSRDRIRPKQAVTTKNELKKKATTQDSTVILLFQDEDKKFLASPQIISGKSRTDQIQIQRF